MFFDDDVMFQAEHDRTGTILNLCIRTLHFTRHTRVQHDPRGHECGMCQTLQGVIRTLQLMIFSQFFEVSKYAATKLSTILK